MSIVLIAIYCQLTGEDIGYCHQYRYLNPRFFPRQSIDFHIQINEAKD